jgi:hypothetical protein
MSDDEIKLVATLARDPTWSPDWLDDPYLTQTSFQNHKPDAEPWSENAADAADLWFTADEITAFLRYFCYWNDLSPKTIELRHWLGMLSQKHVKLCDLTPEAWGRIIQTETIKRLNP